MISRTTHTEAPREFLLPVLYVGKVEMGTVLLKVPSEGAPKRNGPFGGPLF